MRESGFEATVDFERLDEPDVIIICVPTPLTDAREPDLTYIVNSARAIAERLRPGQLVVLESTTYPGHDPRGRPAAPGPPSGLKPGVDFFLAFSPEREDPGNPQFSAPTIPKVVGGLDAGQPGAGRRALRQGRRPGRARLQPRGRRGLQDPREHLPRHQHRPGQRAEDDLFDRMGIDVWEVIEAAKTKPFGFQAFYPGPGLGRALHPDRPVLSDLGGPQARPDHAVHRAGRRDQHVDARVRRQQGRRRAQRPTASRSRGARSPCWAWPTRRTWTTPASRPASS